jgi:hypothetical protein
VSKRTIAALGLAITIAGSIALAATPRPAGAACRSVDGTSPTGLRTGANPVRFWYSNSPYIGLRYDGCADLIRMYYGGYVGNTHYNLRFTNPDPRLGDADQKQIEVPFGAARVYSVGASNYHTGTGGRRFFASVQACKRGTGPFSTSTCGRWSPVVSVLVDPTS